ncbi:hypothetical protein HZS_2257 [Henneguya salminicola]|nr:hypothetical protein HZS_2257 [Henneguya salminicola]
MTKRCIIINSNANVSYGTEENIANNFTVKIIAIKTDIVWAIILTILTNAIAPILFLAENVAMKLHAQMHAGKENAFTPQRTYTYSYKKYRNYPSACVMTSSQAKTAVFSIILTEIGIMNLNFQKNKIGKSVKIFFYVLSSFFSTFAFLLCFTSKFWEYVEDEKEKK